MSIGFKKIEDSVVIYKKGGYYKQSQAYERKGNIYLKDGSGFLKIAKDGRTTSVSVSVDEYELPELDVAADSLGYLHATK